MSHSLLPRPIRGIVPPLVTPLTAEGDLDHDGLHRLIEHIVAGGVSGIFLLGTTGEGPALSYSLRRELIEAASRQVAGRVPVLVGITDTCWEESRALAAHAASCGADAVVCSAPYYFAVSQSDLLTWIERLSAQVPLPLFVYNMPGRTHASFLPETVARMAELPRVCGLKDSSGSLQYVREAVERFHTRPDFAVLVGPENLLLDSLRAGAHGGVNGGANLFPRLFVGLFRAFQDGDLERAHLLQKKIDELGPILHSFGEAESSYLRGLKLGLALRGICQPHLTQPFRAADPEKHHNLRAILEEYAAL